MSINYNNVIFLTFELDNRIKRIMKLYCEVVIRDVLPALRSLVTRELLLTHRMSQTEVSKKLGVTQPAVSQYKKALRGTGVRKLQSKLQSNKEVASIIREFSKELANKNIAPEETQLKFLEISHKIIDEGLVPVENHIHSEIPCHICFKV